MEDGWLGRWKEVIGREGMEGGRIEGAEIEEEEEEEERVGLWVRMSWRVERIWVRGMGSMV